MLCYCCPEMSILKKFSLFIAVLALVTKCKEIQKDTKLQDDTEDSEIFPYQLNSTSALPNESQNESSTAEVNFAAENDGNNSIDTINIYTSKISNGKSQLLRKHKEETSSHKIKRYDNKPNQEHIKSFDSSRMNYSQQNVSEPPLKEKSENPAEEAAVPGSTLGRVLLISLGGGEDEKFVVNAAEMLSRAGHDVVMILYGDDRETLVATSAKLLVLPFPANDLMSSTNVAGSDEASEGEWASGLVIQSRLQACASLHSMRQQIIEFAPALLITPLWLHDVCTLSLAQNLTLPVVGVLTSRFGAWWCWTQLGALPDLASANAPTGAHIADSGIFARASNMIQHYSFVASARQRWQAPATAALPVEWQHNYLPELYQGLRRLLVSWDPLLHPNPPHTPSIVSVGAFAAYLDLNSKDRSMVSLLNGAGVVTVNVGGREVWAGGDAVSAVYSSLAKLPYTVLWSGHFKQQRPQSAEEYNEERLNKPSANRTKFVFKDYIPLNAVLNHPRHRLLISCCGEFDVMIATHYASPVLCLPVTVDQKLAAKHLSHLGVAEVVPAAYATPETVTRALMKLLSVRSYRISARDLAEDLYDQPVSPADNFLYHVQHSLRRPNSSRYRIKGSILPLIQQGNADVFLLLLAVFTLGIAFVSAAIKVFMPILMKRMKRKID